MRFKRNFNNFISQYVGPYEYTAVQDPTLKRAEFMPPDEKDAVREREQ